MTTWFVVPCLDRYEMTRVTLGWLSQMRSQMPLEAVVIASDANLDTAEALGFHSLQESSERLGAKINDGYEYALSKGADFVVHWQSDNLGLPEWFKSPKEDEIRSGTWAAMLEPDRLAYLNVEDRYNPFGAGPFMFPAEMLEPTGGRPIQPDLHNGVDGDLVRTLLKTNRRAKVVYNNVDPLQLVSLKDPISINSFTDLEGLATSVADDPWGELSKSYPDELVGQVRLLYEWM